MASVDACMMLRYFISLFRIDIADSAQPKVLDGHQTLFLVRGCGLGTRLVLYVKLVMSVYYKLRVGRLDYELAKKFVHANE